MASVLIVFNSKTISQCTYSSNIDCGCLFICPAGIFNAFNVCRNRINITCFYFCCVCRYFYLCQFYISGICCWCYCASRRSLLYFCINFNSLLNIKHWICFDICFRVIYRTLLFIVTFNNSADFYNINSVFTACVKNSNKVNNFITSTALNNISNGSFTI